MIERLAVKNYKSLEDVEIPLRPLTVFVGPNNAGKSNILDCLRFLSELVRWWPNPDTAVSSRGGFLALVWGGLDFTRHIAIEIDATLPSGPWGEQRAITYRIALVGGPGYCATSHETLHYRAPDGPRKLLELHGGRLRAWDAEGIKLIRDIPDVGGLRVGLRDFLSDPTNPILFRFAGAVGGWHFYNFVPEHMRLPQPVRKELSLQRDGVNVSTVLHALHSEHGANFREIEELLRTGVPEIQELVSALIEPGQTYVGVRESGLPMPIPSWAMSDGTLRFLAHLAVLYSPALPPLVGFEEPENHIHPRLHELLADILKGASKKTQVLVTTHSPYLLNSISPEDLFIVEKVEGKTRCKVAAKENALREALRVLGLGELWYSGDLGGIPRRQAR